MDNSLVKLPTPDATSADMGSLYLLYGLVSFLRPALIVEAGTYKGHATLVMAKALRDNGVDGEVWSADPKDYGAQQLIEGTDLADYVRLYHGDFADMLNGPLAERKIRFAFVDSGPIVDEKQMPEPGCPGNLRIEHFNALLGKLPSHGIIAVDDVGTGGWPGCEEIKQMASLFLPQGKGIAIVQRR